MNDKRVPVFTHIHKTAGTTLNNIITRQYVFKPGISYHAGYTPDLEGFKKISLKEKKKIKIITGHFHFGIHQYCPFPVSYFTMFRDPQKRTISHYAHILRQYKFYPGLKKMQLKKYSLKDFLETGFFDNWQVRYLCGVSDIPFGKVTDEHLQMAIHNLKTWYAVIGIAEFFNESVLLFANHFNWTDPYYVNSNVSPGNTDNMKIDEETKELLKYYNRHDEVLYKTALEIFNTQIERAGPGFKDEVAAFVERNKKRKFLTLVGTHLISKLRFFNKSHLRNMRRFVLHFFKTL